MLSERMFKILTAFVVVTSCITTYIDFMSDNYNAVFAGVSAISAWLIVLMMSLSEKNA